MSTHIDTNNNSDHIDNHTHCDDNAAGAAPLCHLGQLAHGRPRGGPHVHYIMLYTILEHTIL